jgi:hypothetical protein
MVVMALGSGGPDSAAQAQGPSCFSPSSSSPIAVANPPSATGAVTVGDFNRDGRQDLAVANSSLANVAVLIGNGAGGFATAPGSPVRVGSDPASIAVGDFNGDGNQDIATANQGSDNVTILLGNGTGAFAPALGSPIAVGIFPRSVVVGDFNRDGRQDLVVASGVDVTVLLGDGTGRFAPTPGSPLTVASFPDVTHFIAVGDFNGDGRQDLAVTVTLSHVVILLGDGSGGFTPGPGSPLAAGTNPTSVAVGDFNGDGRQDLAIPSTSGMTVLLGNGVGGFISASGSPFSVGTLAGLVAVADFNGDGIQDLAVTNNHPEGSVTVLLGNGAGGFIPASGSPVPAGNRPFWLARGDFNTDGRPDLAVTNSFTGTVTILLGNGGAACGLVPPTPTATATATPVLTLTPTTTLTRTLSPTLTATATPSPIRLTVPEAVALVAPSGQPGVPCATLVAQSCLVNGTVSGAGAVTASQTWTLSATVPARVAVGTVPVAVIATTAGVQGFSCGPVVAGVSTATCTGTTAANALQGSLVTIVFAPGVTVTGTVSGPGPGQRAVVAAGAAPLVPPAPPILLPPPPSPLIPLYPAAPLSPGVGPEVPVIPEAESLGLVVAGLVGLGLLASTDFSRGRSGPRPPRTL